MKNIKKIIFGFVFGMAVLSGISCSPRSKVMKTIENKEGIFAIITTDKGEIGIELFYKETPLTVTNFVGLAEGKLNAANGKPFYDGLKFHRVISLANGDSQDFMIQGGDPLGNGTGGPGYKFPDEFKDNLTFDEPGKLAMANSGPSTNGSQFFITIVPTTWLNGKHTIFGQVIAGQDVVNKTKQDAVIKSIKIIRQGEEALAFGATQADFDRLLKEKLEEEEKAKIAAKEAQEKMFQMLISECKKTSNGIYYKITEEGTGKAIGENVDVVCDYVGYLIDGSIFDASSGFHPKGHEPLEFTTASGMMIPGFDQMVQDMKYGETRTIILPPELAYGERGIPGVIPGNSYICFDVKLVK